ncbi:MAG: SDR family NAD(P)-dependent oxidoreductase [Balneolaceae bacterium]|nr:SDR family NAD(P)-dependent oxidoreductase [Balneolaceae bacterium]
MMNYYQHKTILITGAASGIGKLFAERVSEIEGVRLILWDLNSEALYETTDRLKENCKVDKSIIDITDANRVELEAERLIKQKLVPDLILNCAGIVAGKLFHEHRYQEIDKTIRVNVNGSMYVARAFLNKMIERGSGHIVNMASASGYIGNPKMSVYAASKWAVLGWTESLYLEMKQNRTGIDITAVIPSYIDTGMFEGVKAPLLTPILTTEDIVDRMLKGIAKRKRSIKAPFMVRFTPFLKGILPATLFDWIAGRVFGVYETMDSFKGRETK